MQVCRLGRENSDREAVNNLIMGASLRAPHGAEAGPERIDFTFAYALSTSHLFLSTF